MPYFFNLIYLLFLTLISPWLIYKALTTGKYRRVRLFVLRTRERQAQSYGEHVAVVEALRKHDAPAAQQAMRLHLDNAIADIELRAAAHPQVFAEAGAAEPH